MFFFFNFNKEKRIGFKKLTKSDLGLGEGNQTHIGLFEDVLKFLPNSNVVKSAILVYDNYCEVLECNFDRIKNQDGSFRSPKIKTGINHEKSIVSKIREFAKERPRSNWYLVWTGLENEEITFWLIRGGSNDYRIISRLLLKTGVYNHEDTNYIKVLAALTKKVNRVTLGFQKKIETASQIGDVQNKYRRTDIEKALKLFRDVGTKGESFVNDYLFKQKKLGLISNYVWENQSKESGLPFDFIINDNLYVDVKSTSFEFEQPIYFSNQEIDFATDKENLYSVYRVYDLNENNARMRICSKGNTYLSIMDKHISHFVDEIVAQKAILQTLKLGILPKECFSDILPAIKLK